VSGKKDKSKKAPAPKAAPAGVDVLEEELSEVLRKDTEAEAEAGPLFEPLESAPAAPRKEEVEKAKDEGDLVGEKVKFFGPDEDGERTVLVGRVVLQDPETGDLTIVQDLEDGTTQEWDAKVPDVTVVEAGAQEAPEEEPEVAAPRTAPKEDAIPETTDLSSFEVVYLPIAKVKIAKVKPRLVDKGSEKYLEIKADVERRMKLGQPPLREAIIVAGSKDDATLVEGNTRLEIMRDLGRTLIPCRIIAVSGDTERLLEGFRANVHRREMHWLDLAGGITALIAGGMKQKDLAVEFGINPSEISRMKAATGLAPEIHEKARAEQISRSAVLALASAPAEVTKKVQAEVLELIEDGEDVSEDFVRRISTEARHEADQTAKAEGRPTVADRRRGGPPSQNRASYRDLSVKDVGDLLSFRVRGDRIEATFTLMHGEKSFEGFDLVQAIRDALDVTFGNKKLAVRSLEDLNSALEAARAEVAS
jgi:hypothetical protein